MSKKVASASASVTGHSRRLADFDITVEDILTLQPVGIVSGASLWVRCRCPTSKDALIDFLRTNPPVNSHGRSGYLAGIALLLTVNARVGARTVTSKQQALIERMKEFLPDFLLCITDKGSRTNVKYNKEGENMEIQFPTALVNDELKSWCSAPYPEIVPYNNPRKRRGNSSGEEDIES